MNIPNENAGFSSNTTFMKKIYVLLCLFIFFYGCAAFSQEKGSIAGVVTDANTQVLLKDINVKILGAQLTAKTKDDGSFMIQNVPVGTYEVEFTSASYKTFTQGNVVVYSDKINEFSVELQGVTTEEVTVESSRFQKPSDVTTSYKSLSFEEIRRFPGGLEDIGRVIQNLPGVSLSSDGRNDLIVRGGSPSENLFVVDGFLVNNINHFGAQGATGGPVSILNLDLVQEVSFLTGGFSARYGDKLSSVVEIKQRDGNTNHFYGKVNLSGTGFGANFEGPISKQNKSSWMFSARRSYLDIFFNAAGFSFVPEYTDFEGKVNYQIGAGNFLEFSAFGALDNVKFNNNTTQNVQDNERILTDVQKSYSSGFSWKSLLSKNSYSMVTLSRNYTNYTFLKRDSSFVTTFNDESKESDIQLKAEYFVKLAPALQLSAGTGAQTIKLDYNIQKNADTLFETDPNTGQRIVVPAITILNNSRTFKAFGYAELIYDFMKRFKLTAGARTDYFDLIQKKNYISPRASLAITITPKISLNLSYGIFYQSPSYIWIIGNPSNNNLTDIRADHYIAGIEYLFDQSAKLTVEGYYKKYSDYPVSTVRPYLILADNAGFETENSFGLEPLQSAGAGNAKGFEIYLQKTLTKDLYGAVSFSYSDVKYKAYDGIERRSDWDNRYVLNINGGYKLGTTWEFSAKFRIAGGRPYTHINPNDGSIDYTQYNSARLPEYDRLDVRAEKRWFFKKWTLTTYIDIENIYNKKNLYQYRWDQFNRQIVEDRNLGILPSIGVSAEF